MEAPAADPPVKRNRFEDRFADVDDVVAPAAMAAPTPTPSRGLWEAAARTPRQGHSDGLTPTPGQKPSRWGRGATPTPLAGGAGGGRWDQATPSLASDKWNATPSGATPAGAGGETPRMPGGAWSATPLQPGGGATPVQPGWRDAAALGGGAGGRGGFDDAELDGLDPRQQRMVKEMRFRNRWLTDEELDAALPPGYEIVPVPAALQAEYDRRKRLAQERHDAEGGDQATRMDVPEDVGENLPPLRPEDAKMFELLLRYRHVANDADLPPEVAKSVMVLRCLLKVKNGDSKQRKAAYRTVVEKAVYFGPELLFKHIFDLWMSNTLDDAEKHAVVKLIDRALFKLGDLVTPHVTQILTLVQPLLADPDLYNREEGREVIANLARAVGLKAIVLALKRDIDDTNDDIRQLTARTMGVVAATLGVAPMLEFLRAVCTSQRSAAARLTGARIVHDIAVTVGAGVRKDLGGLIAAIAPCLEDQQVRVKIAAATALGALADAASPHGIEEFSGVLPALRSEVKHNRGKVLGSYLRTLGCLISLMAPADAAEYTAAMQDTLKRGFSTVDEELRRVVLRVLRQVATHPGVPLDLLQDLAGSFFQSFWTVRVALDRRCANLLLVATVALAKRVGAKTTLQYLGQRLREQEADQFQKVTLDAIHKVIDALGTADVGSDLVTVLVDAVIEAVHADTTGNAFAAVYCLIALCNSLERRMAPFVPQIIGLGTTRLPNALPNIRRQAAQLLGLSAAAVAASGQHDMLPKVGRALADRLSGEVDADALAAVVRALRQVFDALPSPAAMQPGPAELLQQLAPVVKNPNDDVQEHVIQLIGTVARAAFNHRELSTRELRLQLFNLANDGLFYLLKSGRKRTRVATSETFADIAVVITPGPIVKQLLNNLKKDNRTERICTEVALAVVAKRCHAWFVVPFLVNEFRLSQGTELAEKTQHAVLKTLRFLFEYLGDAAAPYVQSVVPLLEWSLTEKSLQHRRMACEVVRHMALCVVGQNYEDVMLHLLNLIHPNLIETTVGAEQVRLTTAVTECFEAARLVVNPSYLLRLLEQGMWHPARKVRESYWRVYNCIYLGCGDSLVPAYAPVPDEGESKYARDYLMCVV